ncbi:universal stress protein [Agromyces mangrovi Wang et al. 2018]|uniref:universal stress protein n=1 Tax=Agromyces mangrovi TaxID=1858653 RepID=UPI0025745A4D|nr:universal stress protein [Agromyces mangrovi]BDZ64261.1 hypothetical protein GCM10025877_11990 [Agromyces mangrovi]
MPDTPARAIVAGIVPGQPSAVVRYAARLAATFGVPLECAYVDVSSYAISTNIDGSILAVPIDPDGATDAAEETAVAIEQYLRRELAGAGIDWRVHLLAGNASRELERLADEVDAELIVVGTRERGVLAGLAEFLSGSIAAQLSHRQCRPVVVVPLQPATNGEALPWDEP